MAINFDQRRTQAWCQPTVVMNSCSSRGDNRWWWWWCQGGDGWSGPRSALAADRRL